MNMLSSAPKPTRHPFLVPLLFVVATCVFPNPLRALEEFPYDLRLGRNLTQIQMYDYALLQFELMLKRYPDNQDRVLLEKSRALYASGKRKLGDEAVKGIKPDSPAYIQAQLLIGEIAFKRHDHEAAGKAYSSYFAKMKEPSGDDAVSNVVALPTGLV